MIKKTFIFCPLALLLLFSFSCKDKLDVNGPWKETMVIYGLLNPADTAQYIKINKAFLGKANAYDMAKVADSSNYPVGIIDAHLEQWSASGSFVKNIPLSADESLPKQSGTFANAPNILYKTNQSIVQDGSTYKIVVKNTSSGATVSSSTPIIGKVLINSPKPNQSIDWTANFTAAKPFKVSWNTAPGGKVYQLSIRFFYQEVPKTSPLDTVNKYLDWTFGEMTSISTDGGETLTQEMIGEDFYKLLESKIPVNSDLVRVAGKLQFTFTMGAEELYNYILVNSPSSNIVQDKPNYSNITGGVGIFSSRSVQSTPLLKMATKSLIELTTNEHTKDLGF